MLKQNKEWIQTGIDADKAYKYLSLKVAFVSAILGTFIYICETF